MKVQQAVLDGFVGTARMVSAGGWTRGLWRVSALLARVLPQARAHRVSVPEVGDLVGDCGESMCCGTILRATLSGSEVSVLRRMLRPGDVVYDVGASYGLTTSLSSKLVGTDGRVVAFEPTATALRLLATNAATRPNVEIVNVAIGARREAATFYTAEKADMSSLTARASEIPIRSEELVQVWPLDQVVAERGFPLPDFIKCDVEGAELHVFAGAVRVLGHGPTVLFEYSEVLARPHGYRLPELLDVLRRALPGEPRVFRVAESGEMFESLDDRPGISNNYLVVPEKHVHRLG